MYKINYIQNTSNIFTKQKVKEKHSQRKLGKTYEQMVCGNAS